MSQNYTSKLAKDLTVYAALCTGNGKGLKADAERARAAARALRAAKAGPGTSSAAHNRTGAR